MVKAVILDVDGVVVGDIPGVNLPIPHTDVIKKFRELREKGIPVILCTAKFGLAIVEIIEKAHLNNPHITDGGALVIDPLDHKVIKKHTLEKEIAKDFIKSTLEKNLYTELFTDSTYYIQTNQANDFTKNRSVVARKDPNLVESLFDAVDDNEIIKVISFVKGDEQVRQLEEIKNNFEGKINFIWTTHPFLKPFRGGVVTASGVSKQQGAREAAENLGISFDEILGIGDSLSDWSFMQDCRYVATLENGDDEIKTLVKEKGDHGFIAPHVNDNGILDIFKYFSL